MAGKAGRSEETPERRNAALKQRLASELIKRLSTPTETLPVTRCLSRASLNRVVASILGDWQQDGPVKLPFTRVSLFDWLMQLNLASPVPLEPPTPDRKAPDLWLVDIGVQARPQLDPVELLLAHRPDGVVCGFTAVVLHELTTQPAAHHHVATISKDSPPRTLRPPWAAGSQDERAAGKRPDGSLDEAPTGTARDARGQLEFRYEETPYFLNKRRARLLHGVQLRHLGPRVLCRVTTIEQTLIDSLRAPATCGGPEIVFEAWEEGLRRIDQAKLAACAEAGQESSTLRRLGAMLNHFSFGPEAALRTLLERAAALSRPHELGPISLLPGIPYSRIDAAWDVAVP